MFPLPWIGALRASSRLRSSLCSTTLRATTKPLRPAASTAASTSRAPRARVPTTSSQRLALRLRSQCCQPVRCQTPFSFTHCLTTHREELSRPENKGLEETVAILAKARSTLMPSVISFSAVPSAATHRQRPPLTRLTGNRPYGSAADGDRPSRASSAVLHTACSHICSFGRCCSCVPGEGAHR